MPLSTISGQIWDAKYRLKADADEPVDRVIFDTWRRVARALAITEADPSAWEEKFYAALTDFKFLPAGRILAGAGTGRDVTLFNCFVMGTIPDDMAGIFGHLREAAITMRQGGGIGHDFSTLRPRGTPVRGVGTDASGPLSFMEVWDAMCRTIISAGHRRSAMMATLRCDHPDIEAFVDAKGKAGRLSMFNLSVLVTDAFMAAVKEDAPWRLVFEGTVHTTLRARDLWNRIIRANYEYAEPGVIFIDRVNQRNNLHYCETLVATNPCGELPLPPYGACLLGSINLPKLVLDPFTVNARLDTDALAKLVAVAVRMMDNVTDVSRFPLAVQAREAKAKRRIGLGITGLADALIMCRLRYGSQPAVRVTETWMAVIQRAAYLASIELAREKGAFPLFDRDAFLASKTVIELDEDVKAAIAAYGIRNATLTSVAPAGTISLLADNVSSGIEPVFAYSYTRRMLAPDGTPREENVSDYAYRLYRNNFGEAAPLPYYFVTAQCLAPSDHVVMQAAVQKFVDASVSKTINVPIELPFESFKDLYTNAYALGCKGCTTYRPNRTTGAILSVQSDSDADCIEAARRPAAPQSARRREPRKAVEAAVARSPWIKTVAVRRAKSFYSWLARIAQPPAPAAISPPSSHLGIGTEQTPQVGDNACPTCD